MKSQEKMIQYLESSGIKVHSVMKALVPICMFEDGNIQYKEMDIIDAYEHHFNSPMRNYDPFTNKFVEKS